MYLSHLLFDQNVSVFLSLIVCQFRSGIRVGPFLFLHAHTNASMSATEAHLTWSGGSWDHRPIINNFTNMEVRHILYFLLFLKSSRSLTLNSSGSSVLLTGCLSLALLRFIVTNIFAFINISIDSKEDLSPKYHNLGCNSFVKLGMYTSLPNIRKMLVHGSGHLERN